MKPTSITIQHTRQVRQYEPVVISITADLKPGEDIMKASTELQKIVLRIIFKDQPKTRDEIIKVLCAETEPETPKKQEPEDDSFPDFAP